MTSGDQGKALVMEIGTEEIPPLFLPGALETLREAGTKLLASSRLACGEATAYATPRRLVFFVSHLAGTQSDVVREIPGPPKRAAFHQDGTPTEAALGFARAHGVPVNSLVVKETERGAYVCAVKKDKGRKTEEVLRSLLPELVGSISFQKTMRWNSSGARFARPVRWILALYGEKVIPFSYGGVRSGRLSRGHPVSAPGSLSITNASRYIQELEKAGIIVDHVKRKAVTVKQLTKEAQARKGSVVEDSDLLERTIFMTEAPWSLTGRFPQGYLDLPREILISVMREQQGYFSLVRKDGALLPFFICVCDAQPGAPQEVARGHERVLTARLEDARFYLKEDQKIPFSDRIERLKGMVFQEKLGTLYDKVERIKQLVRHLLNVVPLDAHGAQQEALRAAHLCKADLTTGMVGEFPHLQGVIGREYARLQGEKDEVAKAIEEHYLPTYAGDRLPSTLLGRILAVADKMDTIAGCFAAGLIPTGSEDPYALRRQGLGLLQIVLDAGWASFHLGKLIEQALHPFRQIASHQSAVEREIRDFFRQRMEHLLHSEGCRADMIEAVLSSGWHDDPLDAARRARALRDLHRKPLFEPLMITFKRAVNILSQGQPAENVRESLLEEKEERELWAVFQGLSGEINKALEQGDYTEVLTVMARLKEPIDRFFDKVLVMDPDKAKQTNRLGLLSQIGQLFYRFADFSKIAVEGKKQG